MGEPGLGEFIVKSIQPGIKPVVELLLDEETPEKAKVCNKIILSLATIDDTKLLSIIAGWKRSKTSKLPNDKDKKILEVLVKHYNLHKNESEDKRAIPLVTLYKMIPFENHIVRYTMKKLQKENLVKPMGHGCWIAIMETVENFCLIK